MHDDERKAPPDTTTGAMPLNVKVGAAVLVAGFAAWIWSGNWRWAVMGLLGLALAAIVLAPHGGSRKGAKP